MYRWLVFATDEYSLGIVTMLSLRTSSQTGEAIRSPLRIDNRLVSFKEYGLPRRFAPRNDILNFDTPLSLRTSSQTGEAIRSP